MVDLLSLQSFISQLAEYWCLDPQEIDVERPLDELGIDSLGKLELLIMLEDFGGHEIPDDVWSEVTNLRDIYGLYEVYASRDQRASLVTNLDDESCSR